MLGQDAAQRGGEEVEVRADEGAFDMAVFVADTHHQHILRGQQGAVLRTFEGCP